MKILKNFSDGDLIERTRPLEDYESPNMTNQVLQIVENKTGFVFLDDLLGSNQKQMSLFNKTMS